MVRYGPDVTASRQESVVGSAVAEPIRLLICDDHRLLGDALSMVVRLDPGLTLVADPFDNGAAVIAAVAELTPDVVLMDVDLHGDLDGIEATARIVRAYPATKVLVMSGSGDSDELLVRAVEAGAAGFVSKVEAATKILVAVRAVAAGESLLDTATLGWVLRRVQELRAARRGTSELVGRLTEREMGILSLLTAGTSNADIADHLLLSVHTVNTHVRNVLTKLEVHSKSQAVAWAMRSGTVAVSR